MAVVARGGAERPTQARPARALALLCGRAPVGVRSGAQLIRTLSFHQRKSQSTPEAFPNPNPNPRLLISLYTPIQYRF